MSYTPNPLEHLFLLRLAVADGGDWLSNIKPELKPAVREQLVRAGFIEGEKRHPQLGSRSRRMYLSLTDEGWAWVSANLGSDLPPRAPSALETLRRLLPRLHGYLDANQLSLAEVVQASTARSVPSPANFEREIETAYYHLSGGRPNVRVRLAELRSALSNVPRIRLDDMLLSMATRGRVALYRLDNPIEIRAQDREAALRTPSGEERHIIYLESSK